MALSIGTPWPLLCALVWRAHGHGFVTIKTEQGDRLGARNVIDWVQRGANPAELPNGVGYYYDPLRTTMAYSCGSSTYDSVDPQTGLRRAPQAGFQIALPQGSRFDLENWVTANHGGAASLSYACAAPGTSTPASYSSLDWKVMMPIEDAWPAAKRNGVSYSRAIPGWYAFAGGLCNYSYDALPECDDCQFMYGNGQTAVEWNTLKDPLGQAPPLAGGQKPAILRVRYQVPAVSCQHLVFKWTWRTPHMCVPREFVEKDLGVFQRACNNATPRMVNPSSYCPTYNSDEIFQNCIDATTVPLNGIWQEAVQGVSNPPTVGGRQFHYTFYGWIDNVPGLCGAGQFWHCPGQDGWDPQLINFPAPQGTNHPYVSVGGHAGKDWIRLDGVALGEKVTRLGYTGVNFVWVTEQTAAVGVVIVAEVRKMKARYPSLGIVLSISGSFATSLHKDQYDVAQQLNQDKLLDHLALVMYGSDMVSNGWGLTTTPVFIDRAVSNLQMRNISLSKVLLALSTKACTDEFVRIFADKIRTYGLGGSVWRTSDGFPSLRWVNIMDGTSFTWSGAGAANANASGYASLWSFAQGEVVQICFAAVVFCMLCVWTCYQLRSLRFRWQRRRQHACQLKRTVLESTSRQGVGEDVSEARMHLPCHTIQGTYELMTQSDPLRHAYMEQSGVIRYSRLLEADVDKFLTASDMGVLPLASSKMRGHVKALFVVTLYTEDQHLVERTLVGIHNGILDLIRGGIIRCWDEAVVCIVADGINHMSDSTRKWFTDIGMFDAALMTLEKDAHSELKNQTPIAIHCFESLIFPSTGSLHSVPMQAMLLVKPENKGKLDSQVMAFVGIGERLMPVLSEEIRRSDDEALNLTSENRFLILLDAGTVPKDGAMSKLLAPMITDKHIGGTCGHMLPQQSDDDWWKWFHPERSLAVFQIFEYQISHFLDKAFQCMFGYIQVLPGAFSAYRYDAIRRDQWVHGSYQCIGPLVEYFKCSAPSPLGLNVRMVEDRLLPFLLVAQEGCKHTTWYQYDAAAVTDVPLTFEAFLNQRRRWNNGAFATVVHLWLLHHRILSGTKHSIFFRFICTIQVALNTFEAFLCALVPGTFYALIATAFSEFGNWLSSNIGECVLFAYLCSLIFQIFLHADKTPRSLFVLKVISGFYSFLMMFGLVAVAVSKVTWHWALIVVPAGTVLVSAVLHGRVVSMILSTAHFICWLPVVQVVVRIHGFCNFHLVGWRGNSSGSEVEDRLIAFRQCFTEIFIISNMCLIILARVASMKTFFTSMFCVIVGICSIARLFGSLTYLWSWLMRKAPSQSCQDLDTYLIEDSLVSQHADTSMSPKHVGTPQSLTLRIEMPRPQLSTATLEIETHLRDSLRLDAFEFPRYVACLVVVAFHLYAGQVNGYPDMGDWKTYLGPAWETWLNNYSGPDMVHMFFMLSGFVVTYSRYSRNGTTVYNETMLQHWARFVIRICPTYFLALLLTYSREAVYKPYWRTIPANILMVQTWGIHSDCDQSSRWVCSTQPMIYLWYIANLSFCRLVFPIVYRCVAKCSKRAFWWFAFSVWFLHLLEPTFWSVCAKLEVPLDTRRAFYAHPVFHLNVFIQGMFLCRAFVDILCAPHPDSLKMHVVKHRALKCWFLPTLGITAYVLVCCFYQESWWLMRRSIISIIWAVFIFGLAAESDIFSWVFKCRPFIWAGKVSYEMYIMQTPVAVALTVWFELPGRTQAIVFPFALHLAGIACHYLLQEPVAYLMNRRFKRTQSKEEEGKVVGESQVHRAMSEKSDAIIEANDPEMGTSTISQIVVIKSDVKIEL